MPLKNLTHDVFRYALSHLEKHKAQLDDLITHVRTQIGTSILPDTDSKASPASVEQPKAKTRKKKRVMSAEARAKIAAAQKARWKKFHAAQQAPVATVKGAKAPKPVAAKKAVKKAAKTVVKATGKKRDNSDIPF
jgi:hypothetical protein